MKNQSPKMSSKRRKVDFEGHIFKKEWTEKCFFIKKMVQKLCAWFATILVQYSRNIIWKDIFSWNIATLAKTFPNKNFKTNQWAWLKNWNANKAYFLNVYLHKSLQQRQVLYWQIRWQNITSHFLTQNWYCVSRSKVKSRNNFIVAEKYCS